MTPEEFNKLPHFEQEELVHEKAKSLYESRPFGEYNIYYFALFSFVVEVYVFTETGKNARFKAIADDQAPASFRLN
jgi:hypothetical protein